jgi:hypothetical protein
VAANGIGLSIETNIPDLARALGKLFPPREKSRILEDALKKAITPTYLRLVQLTPVGPTGNLKRAVGTRTRAYVQSGNAVGIVGYRRAGAGRSRSAAGGEVQTGPDRAFHQWWVERGTRDRFVSTVSQTPYTRGTHVRRTRGGGVTTVRAHQVAGQQAYIASSYRELGPFKFVPTSRQTGRVQTDPAYPKAFFKKSRAPIRLPGVTPGGVAGTPPLETAWEQTSTTVAAILEQQVRVALEQSVTAIASAAGG